jgi:hypothetical protein
VDEHGNLGVAEADLVDELAQLGERELGLLRRATAELLVVDRQMNAEARLCCCARRDRSL